LSVFVRSLVMLSRVGSLASSEWSPIERGLSRPLLAPFIQFAEF